MILEIKKENDNMEKLNTLLKLVLVNLPFVLVMLGIGSIVYASFLFSIITGFLTLGIALILVAYLISPQKGGDVR